MWRAFFLAVGATLCILGLECMVIDTAVMASKGGATQQNETEPIFDDYGFEIGRRPVTPPPRKVEPPEWAPWSLLSTGAIVLLYAFTSGRG